MGICCPVQKRDQFNNQEEPFNKSIYQSSYINNDYRFLVSLKTLADALKILENHDSSQEQIKSIDKLKLQQYVREMKEIQKQINNPQSATSIRIKEYSTKQNLLLLQIYSIILHQYKSNFQDINLQISLSNKEQKYHRNIKMQNGRWKHDQTIFLEWTNYKNNQFLQISLNSSHATLSCRQLGNNIFPIFRSIKIRNEGQLHPIGTIVFKCQNIVNMLEYIENVRNQISVRVKYIDRLMNDQLKKSFIKSFIPQKLQSKQV